MNVVFVTLVDPTGASGQNVYSRNVASALAGRDDVSLTLICPEPTEELPAELSAACSDIKMLPEKANRSIRWHIRIQRILYRQLRTILHTEAIDILLSTLRPSLLIPPYLARRHGTRYRILVEGEIGHGVDNLSVLPLDILLSDLVSVWNIQAAERCYVVNSDVETWIHSLPLSEPKIEVLSHGIDVPQILRSKDPLDQTVHLTSEHEFTLCYVGSFKKYHCLPSLIEGVANLRESGIDIGLSLVGVGPEYEKVQAAVQGSGISTATTFHGFIDPSKVPEYIRASDACYGVIDPARAGSPMKVYEYLANGIPVIATSGEEFSFVEDEDVGILVNEPTPRTVGRAIERLYNLSNDKRAEMGERAREAGHAHGHTWGEFAQRLIAD